MATLRPRRRPPCEMAHIRPRPKDTACRSMAELALRRLGSALIVLVMAPPPDAGLVAPLGGAVEPLVHAPQGIQSARKGGIGVVDDAVVERERAHTRALAPVSVRVSPAFGRELRDGCRDLCRDD